MDKDYNNIIKEFPNIFQLDKSKNHSINIYGIECDSGWYDLIYNCTKQISDYCYKNTIDNIYVLQIKEKLGGLRYYLSCSNELIEQIIYNTENLSITTCELCGNKGKICKLNGFLLKCLCKKCKNNRKYRE